ncbi:MAG: hypothetical protein ACREV5_20570 [Steroidobacter sp.]
MPTYMFAAGVLALVVGVVHSVLGEILIFRQLRNRSLVPAMPAPPVKERHVRIIWASWHVVTVFGWAFGAVLLQLSSASNDQSAEALAVNAAIFAFAAGSFLVLVGAKGKHPGWIAMLGVAALAWLG